MTGSFPGDMWKLEVLEDSSSFLDFLVWTAKQRIQLDG